MNSQSLSAFIWSVADLLRGDYKHSDYAKVIQTLTVLRRADCVLDATKPEVLAELKLPKATAFSPRTPSCSRGWDSRSEKPRPWT